MKKYGHLVTFVGQKYFNLTLPASCLSLNSPPAFISVAGTHQSSRKWGKPPPVGPFPLPPTKVTVLTRATAVLSTTISNKAMTFFYILEVCIDVRKIGKPLAQRGGGSPSEWKIKLLWYLEKKTNGVLNCSQSKQSWLTQMQLTSKLC